MAPIILFMTQLDLIIEVVPKKKATENYRDLKENMTNNPYFSS